jgi:hypothetical protein
MDPRWCTQEQRDTNGNQHGDSVALATALVRTKYEKRDGYLIHPPFLAYVKNFALVIEKL